MGPFPPLRGDRGGWYGIGKKSPLLAGQVGLRVRRLRPRGFWGHRVGVCVARALCGAEGRFWIRRPGWKVNLRHIN